MLNKDTQEPPKVSSTKSLANSPNRQKMSKDISKDGSWSKYFENGNGGGKVTPLETVEKWTIDMSKLFLGHKLICSWRS